MLLQNPAPCSFRSQTWNAHTSNVVALSIRHFSTRHSAFAIQTTQLLPSSTLLLTKRITTHYSDTRACASIFAPAASALRNGPSDAWRATNLNYTA